MIGPALAPPVDRIRAAAGIASSADAAACRTLTLDLREHDCIDRAAAALLRACARSRVVLARAGARGTDTAYWDAILGDRVERVAIDEDARSGTATGRLWSTVAYDPAQQDRFRHACCAQPLHTDGAYVERPPEVVMLACRRSASAGGATVVLDGTDLLKALRAQAPDLLAALRCTTVLFAKGGSRVAAPIVDRDDEGPLLRWNGYALAPGQSDEVAVLTRSFAAFLADPRVLPGAQAYMLAPGDALFLHDRRVLHGRQAFVPDTHGARFLWKSGFDLRRSCRHTRAATCRAGT